MRITRLLVPAALLVLVSCSSTTEKEILPGAPCSASQVNSLECGVNALGNAVVLACLQSGEEYAWTPYRLCSGTCVDGVCVDLPDGSDSQPQPDVAVDLLLPDGAVMETADEPDGSGLFCEPGSLSCLSATVPAVCLEDGSAYEADGLCESGTACDEGHCMDKICEPGERQGLCLGTTSFGVCSEVGTQWTVGFCSAGETCYLGDCVTYQCPPDAVVCKGVTAVQACQQQENGNYEWVVTELCEGGICQDGACLNACEVNIKDNSYLGCNYWALDLPNYLGGATELVAVVVSAPVDGKDTTVTVTDWSQDPPAEMTPAQLQVSDMMVPKGSLKIFMLPDGHDIPPSSQTKRSFQFETDSPVTVHQFNPLNGEGVYTNDASLLLPDNVGGEEYLVMSWPVRENGSEFNGYFTLVATQTGVTNLQIWLSEDVVAGDGVTAMSANAVTPYDFALNQGEVLSLRAVSEKGADLTGTRIVSDQKISVFGGHECANVPAIPSYANYCDHVEQQLFPLQAWGTSYIADAFMPRNSNQKDYYRIMAGADGINVTLSPAVAGPFNNLTKGQYVDFQVGTSVEIIATGPVLVGHFLQGSNYSGFSNDSRCGDWLSSTGIGDPAFTLVVPMDQFLTEYVVLTPETYYDDYINIVAPPNAQIVFDGAPLAQSLTMISSPAGMGIVQLPVQDGIHTIKSDLPIGLTVYGYDCDVSYAYPGGLALKTIL